MPDIPRHTAEQFMLGRVVGAVWVSGMFSGMVKGMVWELGTCWLRYGLAYSDLANVTDRNGLL